MEISKKVELLAPAGNLQAFYGAVNAGANAVYLGGSKFGARAYAENLTEEELVACIRYGRLFGVKVYLTVNTLLKEQEIQDLPGYLEPFYRAGLAGVIVQDIGALTIIRESFPCLELHASTQMTLCASYGPELLKTMGVNRIVPARELSLQELIDIKRRTGMELETFIHGAMCYCYSGQCLFSSILGGRSGNRGRCAQPCRLPYIVNSRKKGAQCYPLSLKDMCTIDCIPDLIEAGIDSFKIEGRMKKPEYAAGVTAIYRKYIDLYYELRQNLGAEKAAEIYQVVPEDRKALKTLYVRSQLQDGYYFRRNGREMITLANPAYSETKDELLEKINGEYLQNRRRLAVKVEAEFLVGKPASVSLSCKETVGKATGELVQPSRNQPVTEEDLRRQLGKLGDTPFEASEMQILLEENAFYPLKQMNELRRKSAEALEQELIKARECKKSEVQQKIWSASNRPAQSIKCIKNRPIQSTAYSISVAAMEQLRVLAEFQTDKKSEQKLALQHVYVNSDLLIERYNECLALMKQINTAGADVTAEKNVTSGTELLAALPYVMRQSDLAYMEKIWSLAEKGEIDGFLVRSLDELGFLLNREQKSKKGVKIRTDAGVYIWNLSTAQSLSVLTDGFCIPYELNAHEQRKLIENSSSEDGHFLSWEKIIYGRIPMMITANCVQKTTDICIKDGQGVLWMKDRYQTDFPVLRNCAHCVNIIYNSVPLALFGEQNRVNGIDVLRLDFTIETEQEVVQVLRACMDGLSLKRGTYTTGHEKRGVD
ncbi:MAG: U32 family peptidase [Acetatifactor sp.]|nr:U32 family peptidase [Acetatifactor sp.]